MEYWREKKILHFIVLHLLNMMRYPYTAQLCPWADSQAQLYAGQFMLRKALEREGRFLEN
jgi:hypothetical protein